MPQRAWDAVIFDKDGTLLDFERTWTPAVAAALADLAGGPEHLRRIADAVGYDVEAGRIRPDAPLVAMSNPEVAERAAAHVDGARLTERLAHHALAHATPSVHVDMVLETLHGWGVVMAVATNDDEASARDQLQALGLSSHFVTIVGCDTGYGTKPGSAMVSHAVSTLGASPDRTIMVGDSDLDMRAARGAGVTAVLVGPQRQYRQLADHWIPTLDGLLALFGAT